VHSAAFKLRTVIWDFAGDPIPDALLEDTAPLAEAAPPDVAELLAEEEVGALQLRALRLLHVRALPVDRTGLRFPHAAGVTIGRVCRSFPMPVQTVPDRRSLVARLCLDPRLVQAPESDLGDETRKALSSEASEQFTSHTENYGQA